MMFTDAKGKKVEFGDYVMVRDKVSESETGTVARVTIIQERLKGVKAFGRYVSMDGNNGKLASVALVSENITLVMKSNGSVIGS